MLGLAALVKSRSPLSQLIFIASAAALLVTDSAFARTAQRTPSRSQSGGQFVALPLQRSPQNHLLVRILINGKPAVFGVDTGAPVSAVAMHRRGTYGLTAVTAGSAIPNRLSINGAFNNVVMAKTLTLGALNLVDEPLVAIDLRGMGRGPSRAVSDSDLDGILGADILIPTKALIDCEKQMLVLNMTPEVPGSAPGVDLRGMSKVPMHVSSGYNLYVDGAVNGHAAKLMVDTGAFATLLHSRFVRSMQIPMRATPFSSSGVNLKQRGVNIATITKLSIGSIDIARKEVGVINLEGLIHAPLLTGTPPVVGLLGSETLRRQHGIIDFGSNTLYLRR